MFSSNNSQKYKSCTKKGGNCFECHKDSRFDNKRFLIIVNVLGSAGPLRFLVNEEDLVSGVIESALKLYAKEGRLPALGSDNSKFLLYCANFGSDALSPWDEVGSCGARNFVLCKKPEQQPNMTEARSHIISRKGSGNWKAWLNKSLTFKISSH
ncbi:uncharacterized protein At4g22758-like [Chenopodium quinoa]|uniref:DUF7054 domain-containing protein n=1 Tax=Chenopodium quinoa TaxID=63459 RepID=A0A803N157_CHEQI|nr:uncharacterized protein At4g22758-like [Chenopodium quinoa]